MGRADDLKNRAQHYAERAEALRADHGSVDAVYSMVDRDGDIGGGIMAGSLAYRIFIWLLPFALVVVGGIGIAASTSETPEGAARSLGLHGLVANSVAQASDGSSRWYALLIGIPLLLWATRGLLRALIIVHRLVWGDPRRVAPKATIGSTVRLLALLAVYFGIRELARGVQSWSGIFLLGTLVGCVGVTVLWLVISLRLPHHDAPWRDLVPGAILMAVGLELLSDVGVYYIAPRAASSESTYGALGIAATLLFGLFLVSRLVVAAAVVNATGWERRNADRGD